MTVDIVTWLCKIGCSYVLHTHTHRAKFVTTISNASCSDAVVVCILDTVSVQHSERPFDVAVICNSSRMSVGPMINADDVQRGQSGHRADQGQIIAAAHCHTALDGP